MAGDWIKMRGALVTDPRVLRIAAIIEQSALVARKLTTGYNGALHDIVTRDVTRDVTLASLLRVWSAVNEHTDDGVMCGVSPSDIDHIAGIPGFGQAMVDVGWALYDEENHTFTFPNFLEHNAPAKNGRASAAERQRRYRERALRNGDALRNVTRDVTDSVTRDAKVTQRREEKRRDNTLSEPSAGRERNPLFDAVVEVTGVSPAVAGGEIGKALQAIKSSSPNVTADEIRTRAQNYRTHMRDAALSPMALAKWWTKCAQPNGSQATFKEIPLTYSSPE